MFAFDKGAVKCMCHPSLCDVYRVVVQCTPLSMDQVTISHTTRLQRHHHRDHVRCRGFEIGSILCHSKSAFDDAIASDFELTSDR